MEHGTVCQIGDNWFYFGCLKAEELDPDEYVKATPEADVVGLICNTLDEFRKSGETFEDEYAYYEAYLNEQRAKAIPTLKERDKRLERLWAEFGDVPMNPETEEIEAPFLCFPAGTNREEVWEWFDERYSRGVAKLLLVGEPKDREVAQALFLTSLCCECDSEHCQSILKNAPDLPAEYRRANKEQVRQRLELARWNLDDLLEDIEDGIVARELKRIYNEYCGGGDDGEV